MTRVYLNTLILLEITVCFGMLAFGVLVKTGLYSVSSSRADYVYSLSGSFEAVELVFEFEPTALVFDIEGGNGCFAGDLNILANQGSCVRNYCSGRDDGFADNRVYLQAGQGCSFRGVLRFVEAGTAVLS